MDIMNEFCFALCFGPFRKEVFRRRFFSPRSNLYGVMIRYASGWNGKSHILYSSQKTC